MEIKALFGILSSLFVFIGGLPYLQDIYYKRVQPHILSWIGWAFITALGGWAMLAGGSQWAVAILFANTLLCLVIVIFSIFKKSGVWQSSKLDFIFFGLGFLGLILWQILDQPLIAIVFALIADFSFGLPTIIKTYKKPTSESYFVWLFASLSGLFSLFAVRNFTFLEAAYPFYLFLFDSMVLLLVLRIIKRPD